MITATIIQFLYSSFLVKFYFQLFQEKTRVLFFNQQMEPEGEISSAPRTIDSCWINNLWKQNPRKSFQKSFKRLLMCLLRSFIFALCFAKLSISSPIRTIKVAEMSASQSWEINGKKGGNPNELSLRTISKIGVTSRHAKRYHFFHNIISGPNFCKIKNPVKIPGRLSISLHPSSFSSLCGMWCGWNLITFTEVSSKYGELESNQTCSIQIGSTCQEICHWKFDL